MYALDNRIPHRRFIDRDLEKKVTHDGEDSAMKHEDGSSDSREYPCLVRVTDGKSYKFSTKAS